MEYLLIKYGYMLLFFGVALEGEAFVLAGAFLASRGIFHLGTVVFIAVAANTIANQIYYLLAAAKGRYWLEERYGTHPRYGKLIARMQRHANWVLLLSRFAFGFRIIIPAACGALGMPGLQFAIVNILSGIIWAVPTAMLGYYFGTAPQSWFKVAYHYEALAVVLLMLIIASILAFRYLRHSPLIQGLKLSDLHGVVPWIIGLMGVINLVSAIRPRSAASMAWVSSWLPLEVTQRSRPLMLLAGLALLQVTRNLTRRKELAWYVATGALLVSLLLHITHALDLHHSLAAALLLVYLFYFRHRFNARSDPASLKWGLLMVPILGVTIFVYGYIGLRHLETQYSWDAGAGPAIEAFRAGLLIVDPNLDPLTERAARFLGSVQIAGWLGRMYVLVLLLRPVILRDRMEAPAEIVTRVVRQNGRFSLSAFAVQSDKHHLLQANGEGLIAYAVRNGVALSCGDPIAPEALLQQCVVEYLIFCRKNGWVPCFYEAAEQRLPVYRSLNLRVLKMAEEAIVDLRTFSLSGNPRANLRAMVNKALKMDLTVSRYTRSPAIDEQLEEISDEWLSEKKIGELGFSLGQFSLEGMAEGFAYICQQKGEVQAFVTWLPYRHGAAVVLDLMRKGKKAPSGTMDLLLAHSLGELRQLGLEEASLANAPLANVTGPHTPLDKGVNLLFENLNSFYGYKNLFQFKKKFAPRWEGRYLVYPAGTDLPKVAVALSSVHQSGGLWELLGRK